MAHHLTLDTLWPKGINIGCINRVRLRFGSEWPCTDNIIAVTACCGT